MLTKNDDVSSPETIDLHDENNIPLLAKRLFESYNHDALPFVVENFFKVIDFLPELYPSRPLHEREKARQILTLEILVKFCQLAEDLAAFAIAFKKRYPNEREEILGIYEAIADYDVGQVMDFYKHIENRDLDYIAQFRGYPPRDIQSHNTRKYIEMSCTNVKNDATEIARLYDNLRLLYDAYKHGYRVDFAKIDGVDSFTFFDKDMNSKVVQVSKDDLDKIRRRAKSCQELFKIIFALHKERIGYEKGGSLQNAPITISTYRKDDDPKPAEGEIIFTYPARGAIDEEFRKKGKTVFANLKEELEKNYQGKIVAVDIDEKRIVASDYEFDKVIHAIHQSSSTGRIMMKRIAKDERIATKVY